MFFSLHTYSTSKLNSYLLSIVILIGVLFLSLPSKAQVGVLKDWSSEYNNTGNLNTTYDAPAGSNRLLVVAIASARDDNGTRRISSITYGGQALSLAIGNMTDSYRAHTSMYYLNEAGLAAAGTNKTLVVNFNNDGTARSNAIFAAVFHNVNQTNPIVDAKQYSNSSESSNASLSNLQININNLGIKIISSYRRSLLWSGSRSINNFGTDWTNKQNVTFNDGGIFPTHYSRHAVGSRSLSSSYLTDNATVTMDGNSYLSMSGISIGAVPKYFRSKATGNWNSNSTWQQSLNGTTWTDASSYPTYDDYKTTIQAGHTVTLNGEAGVSDIDIYGTFNTSTYRFIGANSLNLKTNGKIIIGGNSNIEGFNSVHVEDGSTVEYNGSGNQNIYALSYANLILSGSGGIKTFIANTDIRGDFTVNRTTNANTNVKVQFVGTVNQKITGNTATLTFTDITIHKPAGILTLEKAVSVSNTLTLVKGLVYTGSGLLSVTNTSTEAIVSSNNFADSYIVGPLARNIINQTANNYVYPVGKNGKYYPFNLNNPSVGTGTVTATVQAFDSDVGGHIDGTISSKSNTEYWQLTTTGNFTNAGVSIGRTTDIAPNNIIVGSNSQAGTYTALYGDASSKAVHSSNLIGTNRFFTFGKAAPVLNITPSTLSGFSYSENHGPSAIQTLTISGNHLIGNIRLYSTEHFEISRFDGNQFTPVSTLTLNITGSTLPNTPVYIRLKAGLTKGTYNNTLSIESQDAVTKEISLSGQVMDAPLITLNPTTLSGFTYTFTGGPSASQTFTLSGINLKEDIVLNAPSKYEISKSASSGYSSTLSYTPSNGTLSNQTVYVRLKAGLGAETHIQDIEALSLHAARKTLTLTGTVLPGATIFNSKSILKNFIYTQGSGPSGIESFELSAIDLTADIVIQAPQYFQVSTNGTTWSSSLTITKPANGQLAAQTIYVRLQAGLGVGEYGIGQVITLTSTGAQGKAISVYGRVVNTATVLISNNALNGFGYAESLGGPSPEQFIVVSGSSLNGNITLTPPAGDIFEIKMPSGNYTTQPIVLFPTNGRVNPTIIQIRLKAGLSAGDYVRTMTVSSNGINPNPMSISLIGKVYASPVIAASDDGGGIYCTGDEIQLRSTGQDVLAQYWSGPNAFYSTAKNPKINHATPAMSGTYTVSGNIIIGGNLVFNGDFSLGNLGVNSGYNFKLITNYSNEQNSPLWSESTYAITDIPSKAHPHFPGASNPLYTTGNNKMIVNGSNIAGVIVWSQSIMVVPNADFEFSYTISSMVATDPAQLQFYVNGVPAGPIYEASNNTNESITYSYITHVPDGVEVVNLEIINFRQSIGGNDFALDDLKFYQILIATDSVDIEVHQTVNIDVSITATPSNHIEEGTPVTYTAYPVNPGENPIYDWYINNVKVAGENNVSFTTDQLSNNDEVKCIMTSSLPCTNQDFVTSNTIKMTVTKSENYWVGSTASNGSNWGIAANWSAGVVPDMGTNIEFATAANNGGVAAKNNLQLDIDRTIGNLINKTDKQLIIPTGKSLTVNGNINTNNENKIVIQAASNQLNGTLIFPNVTNPVYATVEMWTKAYINEDCSENCNDKYIWQFFGPPTHSYVLDPESSFYMSAVRKYDETVQTATDGHQWKQLYNYDIIEKFKGYEITQAEPKKITFTGKLVNENMHTGELSVTEGSFYKGWHLLSNPYTAAIGVKDLEFGNGMDEVVYIYNTGSYTHWKTKTGVQAVWNDYEELSPGQYLAIPKNLAGFTAATGVIPSMQAFLVSISNKNSPPSTGKTVSYNYANLIKNTQMQRAKEVEQVYVNSMVTITSDNNYDKLWLFTDEACSAGYDNGWDGKKMGTQDNIVQIAATQGDKEKYQIHATNDIHDTYLLVYPDADNTQYTLHFKHNNTETVYAKIQLYDHFTKQVIDISADGSKYTFTANKTDNPARFKIMTETLENQTKNTFIYPIRVDNKNIYIDNNTTDTGIARLYDISGQLVDSQPFHTKETTKFQLYHYGIYIVQVETAKRLAAQKIFVH